MTEPLTADTSRKRIWGLNPNVFFLGIVSLLTDVSSELIFTLVPLFLRNVLGAARAFVADLVTEEKRGTAYGLYHGVIGLTLLPASLIAGWMWSAISPAAPFYFGAGLAFMAMLGIMALIKE